MSGKKSSVAWIKWKILPILGVANALSLHTAALMAAHIE
jgi:hypothetical protein